MPAESMGHPGQAAWAWVESLGTTGQGNDKKNPLQHWCRRMLALALVVPRVVGTLERPHEGLRQENKAIPQQCGS